MQTFNVYALHREVIPADRFSPETSRFIPQLQGKIEAFNARGALAKVKEQYAKQKRLSDFYRLSICVAPIGG